MFGAQECLQRELAKFIMTHLERNGVMIAGNEIHNYPYLLSMSTFTHFISIFISDDEEFLSD